MFSRDVAGEGDVVFGEAARVMGGSGNKYSARIPDVDVGMMVEFVGDLGDATGEICGSGKCRGREFAAEKVPLTTPSDKFGRIEPVEIIPTHHHIPTHMCTT